MTALTLCGQTITSIAQEDIEIRTDNSGGSYPVEVTSSDLELSGFDQDLLYSQVSYLRFANVSIPAGAILSLVRLKFYLKSSPTSSNVLQIAHENTSNSAIYTNGPASGNNITNLRNYSPNITWNTPNGNAGNAVFTPSLNSILQGGISSSSNSVAFRIRKADYSTPVPAIFNVHSKDATTSAYHPRLIVNYILSGDLYQTEFVVQEDVEVRTDDVANTLPVDVLSSDLELSGFDEDQLYSQTSYLRFSSISLPVGATVNSVKLKFFLKSSPGVSNTLRIAAENNVNTVPYPTSNTTDLATGYNIAEVRGYSSEVIWATPAGNAGNSLLTDNLLTILPVGLQGNLSSLAFRIRKDDYDTPVAALFNVHSKDGANAAFRPQLIITYSVGNPCGTISQNLVIANATSPIFHALENITTTGTILYPSGSREYVAGKSIKITPPSPTGSWETSAGTIFEARINPVYTSCSPVLVTAGLSQSPFNQMRSVGLTWTNQYISNVYSYRLEYAIAGTSNWYVLDTVTSPQLSYTSSTTISNSLFAAGTQYKFRIVALALQGEYKSNEKLATCCASSG